MLDLSPGPTGTGLCARILLPLARTAEAPVRAAPAQVLQDRKILLVEDNETNRLVAASMLSTLGANCVIANDGVEGLDALENGAFDLALIDIEMPRKGGLELIAEIRARPVSALSYMPLVAFTAYALPQHRARIMAAGADGIIVKPLDDIAEFGRRIAGFLGGQADSEKRIVQDDVVGAKEVLTRLQTTLGSRNIEELRLRLVEDLDQAEAKLRHGLDTGDNQSLRAATHDLIALAGLAGVEQLQSRAETLNRMLHSQPDTRIARIDVPATQLLSDLCRVRDILNSYDGNE